MVSSLVTVLISVRRGGEVTDGIATSAGQPIQSSGQEEGTPTGRRAITAAVAIIVAASTVTTVLAVLAVLAAAGPAR